MEPQRTVTDRFRTWYQYECDCYGKTLQMLHSVPESRRSDPLFQRALGLLAHSLASRQRWAHRFGFSSYAPATLFPQGTTLGDLEATAQTVAREWSAYLATLDDTALAQPIEFTTQEGERLRWNLEGALTQVHHHVCYHRGQIVLLVDLLGGETMDSDYIYWTPDLHRIS